MRVIAICLTLFAPFLCNATHLRGGEITLRQLQCGSRNFEITLTIYTNTQTPILAGGGTLFFGDGNTMIVPTLPNTIIDVAFNIGKAVFVTNHQFSSDGMFTISYLERNRNAGILNVQNPGETAFYVEANLLASSSICNNPVSFEIAPIDKACHGLVFTHNPGAVDPDGDSISYALVVPQGNDGAAVAGYRTPNDKVFYADEDFQKANEAQNAPPLFQIDPITGTLTWDAPGEIGEYVAAIKVSEWRKIDTTWVNLGYVIRDMQIIVEDCQNKRPYLVLPADICVRPGDHVTEIIRGIDPDFDPVRIDVFIDDNFYSSAPTFANQSLVQSTAPPSDTANVTLDWVITCDLVREQPYNIVIKIIDQPQNGFRLASYSSLNVTVLGPPPVYKALTLDLAKKTMKIEWNPYDCPNATAMEIWRRVDEGLDNETKCVHGIPRSWGFERIGSVALDSDYVDQDLNPGAKYCYRLVALFQTPFQNLSIASLDTCIGPIVADAPVMTRVSVARTDSTTGEILVQWTSPFEISKSEFPRPYEYELYQTEDSVQFTRITQNKITDTTYTVSGLNTIDHSYGYRVVVYAPQGIAHENPVDTSGLAFYPRLTAESRPNAVYLSWDGLVPWSNQSLHFPWHYIYRSQDSSPFVLIDSVNVNELTDVAGYSYLDLATPSPFEPNVVYHYKVETSGTYGNPKIGEPLLNFSNESFSQPVDKSPPCKPVLAIDMTSCADFIRNSSCDFNDFKNTLHWVYPGNCGNDVAYFRVFYFSSPAADSTQLASTSDLSFTHRQQNTFAGCYKVSAVDRSGNEGPMSDRACNDNCPNVYFPNVFTPANDDGFNDTFPGFTKIPTSELPSAECPRFIKTIDMKIFNRWGEEVYLINSSQGSSSEWTGLDLKGNELPAGVYYYSADVVFEVIDQHGQHQSNKGWVNLVR